MCVDFVLGNLEEPAAWARLERQILGVGDLLSGLGAKYLVLIDDLYSDLITGKLTGSARLNESSWKWLIDTTHKVADMARQQFGLGLVFHAHAETHLEYQAQIELLLL